MELSTQKILEMFIRGEPITQNEYLIFYTFTWQRTNGEYKEVLRLYELFQNWARKEIL